VADLFAVGFAALFGFEYKAVALVEINPPGGGGSVDLLESYIAFEDVGIVVASRIRLGEIEQVAEFV